MNTATLQLEPQPPLPHRRTPLKSVSTRIILCVFVSTLLTAVVVSWLAIGAIRSDVRTRLEKRGASLLAERNAALSQSISMANAFLSTASAIGTPWHTQLLTELDRGRLETRSWKPQDANAETDQAKGGFFPAPPADLTAHFDSLHVRSHDSAEGPSRACVLAEIDIIELPSRIAGHLSGCVSHAKLMQSLQPPGSDLGGMRVLVVDARGQIVNAIGIRGEARLGSRIPISKFRSSTDRASVFYQSQSGQKLVGVLEELPQSGWFLVAETEHANAFAPAIAITNQIFIVDIFIIALFSILAYKVTLAIMQPVEALSLAARRISEGHLDYQIPPPPNSNDELGLLTNTFNEMMRKLRNSQLEIEQDRFRLSEKNEELLQANEILSQLSITDGLTKLHNHRYFQDHLIREIKRVGRTHAPLSLVLLDIDDFKMLNDTHGHAAGDEVLMSLAAIMNDSARESDLIARYGGEEFVILMPNTDLAGAVHLAEKLRMAVETTRLIIGNTMKPIEITISLGVAVFDGNRREFFGAADTALYQAKAAGKNCVIIANAEAHDLA